MLVTITRNELRTELEDFNRSILGTIDYPTLIDLGVVVVSHSIKVGAPSDFPGFVLEPYTPVFDPTTGVWNGLVDPPVSPVRNDLPPGFEAKVPEDQAAPVLPVSALPPNAVAEGGECADLAAVLASALSRARREGGLEQAKLADGEAGTWLWLRSLQAAPRTLEKAASVFSGRCMAGVADFIEAAGSLETVVERIGWSLTAFNQALEDRRPLVDIDDKIAGGSEVSVRVEERNGETWACWVDGSGQACNPRDNVALGRLAQSCFHDPGGFPSATAIAMAKLLLNDLREGRSHLVGFKPSMNAGVLTLNWIPAEIDLVPESEFEKAFLEAEFWSLVPRGIAAEEGDGPWTEIPDDDVFINDEAEFWEKDPELASLAESALDLAFFKAARTPETTADPDFDKLFKLLEEYGPGTRAMCRNWWRGSKRARRAESDLGSMPASPLDYFRF